MKRLLVGVAALTAASTVALADGMPGGRAAVYAPQFSWTGLYVGAHGGWERKDMKGSDSTGANNFPFANNFTDGSRACRQLT